MKAKNKPIFSSDPSEILLKQLTIRLLEHREYAEAQERLAQEHYLGKIKPVGKTLFQAVEYEGQWVALLEWGPCGLKLADRDEWIGWTASQRAERLGLVVQNRRFLVLSSKRLPNLASRSLALSVKALPEHWEKTHGYRPLLAETFTDIEQFEGTCYKAAGWKPCGLSKGFARHRADFYQAHQRPKKLWLKPLHRNARQLLRAMDMPEKYAGGLNSHSPERVLPLKKKQIESLRDILRQVEDPRARNRQFPAFSLLALIAMALLAGRKSLAEIQRYGQFLTSTQRAWLDWPVKKNGKGRTAPSYSALYNLLGKLDAHKFAQLISEWLQSHHGTLPRALALDGKYIRDQVLSVCFSEHESGAPVAIGLAQEKPRSENNKKEGELSVGRQLYKRINLDNAIVTADALSCNQNDARGIVENGGDYLLQIKNERRKALQYARSCAQASPLFSMNR